MKKSMLIIAAALLLLSTDNIIGQIPCNVDPCNVPWTTETLNVPTGCQDCNITVTISSRCNTCTQPGNIEVVVTEITATNECFLNCGLDVVRVFQMAFKYALENNVSLINPNCTISLCEDSYIARNVACWDGYATPAGWVYTACDGVDDCCWYRFVVCERLVGYEAVEIVDWSSGISCGNPPPGDCFYVCEWIYQYFNPERTEEVKNQFGKESFDRIDFGESFIKPNPANDQATFYYMSEIRGETKINIFDIHSNRIFSKSVTKNSDAITIPIDISNFGNGVYFFKVTIDGIEQSSGKFSIIK